MCLQLNLCLTWAILSCHFQINIPWEYFNKIWSLVKSRRGTLIFILCTDRAVDSGSNLVSQLQLVVRGPQPFLHKTDDLAAVLRGDREAAVVARVRSVEQHSRVRRDRGVLTQALLLVAVHLSAFHSALQFLQNTCHNYKSKYSWALNIDSLTFTYDHAPSSHYFLVTNLTVLTK